MLQTMPEDVKRLYNQGKKAGADQIRPDAVKLIFCVFCRICYYLLNVTVEVKCTDTVKSKTLLQYNIYKKRKEKIFFYCKQYIFDSKKRLANKKHSVILAEARKEGENTFIKIIF